MSERIPTIDRFAFDPWVEVTPGRFGYTLRHGDCAATEYLGYWWRPTRGLAERKARALIRGARRENAREQRAFMVRTSDARQDT